MRSLPSIIQGLWGRVKGAKASTQHVALFLQPSTHSCNHDTGFQTSIQFLTFHGRQRSGCDVAREGSSCSAAPLTWALRLLVVLQLEQLQQQGSGCQQQQEPDRAEEGTAPPHGQGGRWRPRFYNPAGPAQFCHHGCT